MRALLALAAFCLTLAGPASSQEKSRFVIVKPAPVAEGGLRGPASATGPIGGPSVPAAPEAPTGPQAPAPLGVVAFADGAAPSARSAARQCRAACDRSYYFCLSADDGDSCPTGWTRCRTRCG